MKRFRPVPVSNRVAGAPDVLWVAGTYTGYRDYNTDIIGYGGLARQPAPPGRPAGLQARVGDTEIGLVWVAPDSYGWPIIDSLVEYRPTGGGAWSAFAHVPTALAGITVTGLTNGQSYDFRVSAVTAAGAGTASLTVTTTPVPFNPSQISGVWGWWAADTLALADAEAVAAWTDSTSAGRQLVQATAGARPIYKTNQINGLPVVRFDGVDDYLSYPQVIGDIGGLQLMVVAKLAAGADGTLLSTRNGAANGWTLRATTGANGSLFAHLGKTPTIFGPAGPGAPSFVLYEVVRDPLRVTTAYINGVGGVTDTILTNPSASAGAYTVGAEFAPALSKQLNGDIAEIVSYVPNIAAADRDRLKAYFASRYGLVIV